ncbi:hypothetical protein J2Z69_002418 [Paenibacillus shirakamiensis]|uniref:Uncharacterized protein n=1 Tax=Paenibacillus shirakamiensis TaxID=1265935 RepID=A0ABS4JI28_9BACL|nr:hypothetical protein [Paenibacillus shirakamiensis]MBP2001375.1 hypothetical protein [Paenibacillus shirakamiensis]
MSSSDRQEKIKQLKINVKRKEVLSTLSGQIPVTIEDFLSIEETTRVSKKVYEIIDTITNQTELVKDYQINVNTLLHTKERTKGFQNNNVAILHRHDRDTGALVMTIESFWGNMNEILSFVGFKDGYRDLVVVDKDLQFGLCIERHEYHNNLVVW